MANPRSWTLPQAARLLREPQHRLIYLCEKGTVVPDLADAHGRGSSRRFSSRNLLEFAVALRLKTLGLPATSIAAILHTLRGFEKQVSSEMRGFQIVEALKAQGDIELRVIIRDGDRLYFLLGRQDQETRLFGGAPLSITKSASVSRLRVVSKAIASAESGRFEGPEGSRYVRLDINIGQIARDLKID